ncbi:MAG: AzlC family ABC transporter permease [Pseudolabrys sp.]|nr:AzlC family ABC transporter permease [Pseudolabrys sp.]
MPGADSSSLTFTTAAAAFLGGIRAAFMSVFFLVLAGTYIGLGALAHDFGLSAIWMMLSTVLVWAGPAQLVLISGIGTGAALIELALAVSLSGIRLFPMVVALLPLVRTRQTRLRDLILPTHLTSVSMWVESFRILPGIAAEHRLAFCNGLSAGFMGCAVIFGFVGYYLAAGLPPLLAATLLFLTPLSFLISTARNAQILMDRLALGIGLVLGAVLTATQVELDILLTGVGGGTLAYASHRRR